MPGHPGGPGPSPGSGRPPGGSSHWAGLSLSQSFRTSQSAIVPELPAPDLLIIKLVTLKNKSQSAAVPGARPPRLSFGTVGGQSRPAGESRARIRRA
eukprot:611306-Hanusia_phi.AAC.1